MEEVQKVYEEKKLIKGLVYCIVCNITGERYYGSTTRPIDERMSRHKSTHNDCISKQIIERGDYHVEVVLECYVENKRDLNKIESDFISKNECINTKVSYRSKEDNKSKIREWKHNNKEKVSETRHNYYINNIEKVKIYEYERRKNSPTIECECGGTVKKCNISKHYKTKKHQRYLESLNQN